MTVYNDCSLPGISYVRDKQACDVSHAPDTTTKLTVAKMSLFIRNDWILLQAGMGHNEMNTVKGLVLQFRSEAALKGTKKGRDHHKSLTLQTCLTTSDPRAHDSIHSETNGSWLPFGLLWGHKCMLTKNLEWLERPLGVREAGV